MRIWPFSRRQRAEDVLPAEVRNLAIADFMATKTPLPVWNKWTLKKAVKDGYKINGWVYRAVRLIVTNAVSVPFVVRRKDDDSIEFEHPISKLLANPNPRISRQDVFELIVGWLELAGNGYLYRVEHEGRTAELWPITPDRLTPITSTESGELVSGYHDEATQRKSTDYTPETLIHLKLMDPANPIIGIGPLQAAARAVDTDIEQSDFNKAANQNRGILDGIFSFKRELTPTQFDTIREKIKELYTGKRNARVPGIIGADATYQRTSLTPAEMDFIESRKFNRDEIYAIFGVPPQLAGSTDSSTYNNYATSLAIFWESTIIPLLDDIVDALDFGLRAEVGEDHYIGYDLSGVEALREKDKIRFEGARSIWEMGIPVQAINERLDLGIGEFPGWDLPWTGGKPTGSQAQEQRQAPTAEPAPTRPALRETRNIDAEMAEADRLATGPVFDMFKAIQEKRQAAVFQAIEQGGDIATALETVRTELAPIIKKTYLDIGKRFAAMVQVEARNDQAHEIRAPSVSENIIIDWIDSNLLSTKDLADLDEADVNKILAQVVDGIESGANIEEIQQALLDTGLFSVADALRLARTLTGTAQSIGLLAGAEESGATHKTWVTAGDGKVRRSHSARNGQTVRMDDRFSGSPRPRAPLDPILPHAERQNCRCSMTFSIQDDSGPEPAITKKPKK